MTIVREAHFYGDQLGEMKRYVDAAELLGFNAEIRLEESVSKHMGNVLKINVTDPRIKETISIGAVNGCEVFRESR